MSKINLTERDIETLKKLEAYDCVRSTNQIGQDLPDMAHSGTIKRLVRLGLARFIYQDGCSFGKPCCACWTGIKKKS